MIKHDDKVSTGLTAANKQEPLLVHMEYRVSLPDHDWVVAARHKLIPSVYAGIRIEKDGWTGTTRSCKLFGSNLHLQFDQGSIHHLLLLLMA